MVCVQHNIGDYLTPNEKLKLAIQARTLFQRTFTPKDVHMFLPQRMCNMAQWLVSQSHMNFGPALGDRRQMEELVHLETVRMVEMLAEAVGRGRESLRVLQNGHLQASDAPGGSRYYTMHTGLNSS